MLLVYTFDLRYPDGMTIEYSVNLRKYCLSFIPECFVFSLAVVTTDINISAKPPRNFNFTTTTLPTPIHLNNGPKTIPIQTIPQTTSRPWPPSPPPTTTTTTTRPRTLNTTSPRHRPPNRHNRRRGRLPRNAPDSNRRRNNHPSSREDILLRRPRDHRRAVYH